MVDVLTIGLGIFIALFVPGFLWTYLVFPPGSGANLLPIRLALSPILSLILLGVSLTFMAWAFLTPLNLITVTTTAIAIGMAPLP